MSRNLSLPHVVHLDDVPSDFFESSGDVSGFTLRRPSDDDADLPTALRRGMRDSLACPTAADRSDHHNHSE